MRNWEFFKICLIWGLPEMAYFIFGYFSMKFGISVDGHKKLISFIEITQEINGREPILSKICIMANVQENIILHYKTFYFGTFYFGKTCADT
jgi:hypothetical protein